MITLSELRTSLGRIVRELDAEALAPEAAATAVAAFAAIEKLAASGKLLAARRVTASGAWRADGARSDADWLARETGVSFGQARATLEAASTLTAVPEVEAAVRAGALSEALVREIAPAAAADPTAVADLLDSARTEAFGKTKERCARVRNAASDDAERYQQIHDRRFLRVWQDQFGAGRLEAAGPPEVIARFRAQLEPHREAAFRRARRAGRQERSEAYAFDGLVGWLDERDGHRCGTTAKPRRRRRNPDAEAIVIADLSAVKRGQTAPGETCEIAGLGPVPVRAARELMGDALLSIVLTDGVDIRTVVHTKRTINSIFQTALLAKGWRCSTPGCANVHRLERDHLEALCLGGWTEFLSLDLKCGRCHAAKTADDLHRLRQRRRTANAPPGAG